MKSIRTYVTCIIEAKFQNLKNIFLYVGLDSISLHWMNLYIYMVVLKY